MHELVKLNRKELDAIFLAGETPTMEEMNGVLDGSPLAGRFVLNFRLFRIFLNLGWFVWRGKVFEPGGENEGKGINRFKIGPFRFLRYRCETQITRPLVGSSDVFNLNYDVSGNPWYIRRIRDDVKRIDNGVYLGSANIRSFGKHRFAVYFLLQST